MPSALYPDARSYFAAGVTTAAGERVLPTLIGLFFDMPETDTHIAPLRKAARDLLEGMSIPREDISDLEMVISELATNAIRHARSGGNYRVYIELTGSQATVTVIDNGVGFSPDAVPEPGTLRLDVRCDSAEDCSDKWRIGGYGLPLVHSLSDEVRIERKAPCGMIVQARKILRTI